MIGALVVLENSCSETVGVRKKRLSGLNALGLNWDDSIDTIEKLNRAAS